MPQTADNVIRKPKHERLRGLPEGMTLVPKSARVTKGYRDPAHRLEFLREARELGLAGATDFEVAAHFGVTSMTINQWKLADDDFRTALQIPKDIADGLVEASLYHKARGYTYRTEEIKVINDQVVRVPTTTHVPPDTTSMIFWLKNRQRDRWRDQQDVNHTGAIDVNVDTRDLALKLLATIQAGLHMPVIEHDPTENENG